jgi:WD40 repeat protein
MYSSNYFEGVTTDVKLASVSLLDAQNSIFFLPVRHSEQVTVLRLDHTATLLASGACDGMVHVLDLQTTGLVFEHSFECPVTCVIWLSSYGWKGRCTFIVGLLDGSVFELSFSVDNLVRHSSLLESLCSRPIPYF